MTYFSSEEIDFNFFSFLQFSAFPRFLQVLSNDIFEAWFSSCVGHFYIPDPICGIHHLSNINHTIGPAAAKLTSSL